MVFGDLPRKENFLLLAFMVTFKVLQVDCQDARLTCTNFAEGEITECNCSLNSALIGTDHKCSPFETNAAYVIVGEKPNITEVGPFKPSPASWCVCCYEDVFSNRLSPTSPFQVPEPTCMVRALQEEIMLIVGFVVNRTMENKQFVTCFSPCMPGNDSIRLTVHKEDDDQQGVSVLVIVLAAVGSCLGAVLLFMAFAFLYVKYQRKQAWVVHENKQSAPPPLPCLQNSGLMYIVDGRGLVVPMTEIPGAAISTPPSDTADAAEKTKTTQPTETLHTVQHPPNPKTINYEGNESATEEDTDVDRTKAGIKADSVKTKGDHDSNVDISEKQETTEGDSSDS